MSKCNPVTFNGKTYSSTRQLANELNLDEKNYGRLVKLVKKYDGNGDLAVPELLTIMAKENKETEKIKSIINLINGNEEAKKSEPEESVEEKKKEKEEMKTEKASTLPKSTRCYYEVDTPSNLINLIESLDCNNTIKKINLIDFENVCSRPDIYEPVLEEENVNIFFYNALKYSDKFYSATRKSNAINIKILTFEVAQELVDHMLVFYLGALNAVKPDIEYAILSKDLGYYRFIENLEFDNIKCVGVNYIQDKDTRYKYCICKFVADSKLQTRNLVTLSEARELFKGFFKNDPTNEDFNNVIKILEKDGLLEQMSKNSLKWLKFKMKEINEFVDIYRP